MLSFKIQCWCYRCTSVPDLVNAWFHSCSGFGLVILACSTKHTLRIVLMHTFTIHYCPTYPLNFCSIPLFILLSTDYIILCYYTRLDIYLEGFEHFLPFCRLKTWCCCYFFLKDTLTAAESVVPGRVCLNAIACRHSQLSLYVLRLLGNRRIECIYLLLENLEWKLMTVF